MIHRTRTYRRILAIVAGLLGMGCAAGCSGPGAAPAVNLAPPVTPRADADLARRWYYEWEGQPDAVAGGVVRDISIVLTSRGRDWRQPEGPDGYPVRVFLLNGLDQYVRADGAIQAFLVYAPLDPHRNKALCAWSIDAEEARRHFRQDKVAGYLLRLDWGASPPARTGTFMLVIRWISKDGQQRLTRNIVFNDRIEHVITTTTSRPSAP